MSKATSRSRPVPFISRVGIENFRGFHGKNEIPLRQLTFIVGPNSSGKSSIFDAMLMMAQNVFTTSFEDGPKPPQWSGDLVDLGSFQDTVWRHQLRLPVRISVDLSRFNLPWMGKASTEVRLTVELRAVRRDPSGRLVSVELSDLRTGEALCLQSSRAGLVTVSWGKSRRTVDLRIPDTPERIPVAAAVELVCDARMHGASASQRRKLVPLRTASYGVDWFMNALQRVASARAAPQRWYARTRRAPVSRWRRGADESGLLDGFDPFVLQEIARGKNRMRLFEMLKRLGIASSLDARELSAYHTAISLVDSITGVDANLMDVGYGVSQALPVLLGCLSATMSPLLVEQPEVHLHPKAQAVLAEILCLTSRFRQVVIETHSEHMINRARIMVAEGVLSHREVAILYVDRTRTGAKVTPIGIGPTGEFDRRWPEGFFDERYQDTMKLTRLQSLHGAAPCK